MLQWLRKCPRLLLFTGAKLATSVAQTLGLLAPQLMLPDEAASVLDKCPQLLGRNAAATQVRAARCACWLHVLLGSRSRAAACAAPLAHDGRLLAPRTLLPAAAQAKVSLLSQLLGGDATVAAMLLRFPAILTISKERLAQVRAAVPLCLQGLLLLCQVGGTACGCIQCTLVLSVPCLACSC